MFDSEPEYTKELSGFSNLVLENFSRLFLYYFLLCSLVFGAFAGHHLIKFVRKRAILIRSRFEQVMHIGASLLTWLCRVARTFKQSCARLLQS